MTMLDKEEHFSKTSAHRETNFGDKVTFDNFSHSAKAKLPTEVTLEGRIASAKAQPSKALSPTVVSPSGRSMIDKEEHSSKTPAPRETNFSGRMTFDNFFALREGETPYRCHARRK